ncbi:hypothetical protein EC957_000103 [Mortierella hygrophila]|uniref:Uncharacterized protein n=1 Tax=Mortierella hygrophila TaxID=979708 RepID=A0A9P6K938_9FUNG|nr:hypothetical protein EC957_000029 [Mortierella hygrophila]KAF9552030.1 hypothetical protein EC957_000103 [Mortierella hygrophila]
MTRLNFFLVVIIAVAALTSSASALPVEDPAAPVEPTAPVEPARDPEHGHGPPGHGPPGYGPPGHGPPGYGPPGHGPPGHGPPGYGPPGAFCACNDMRGFSGHCGSCSKEDTYRGCHFEWSPRCH